LKGKFVCKGMTAAEREWKRKAALQSQASITSPWGPKSTSDDTWLLSKTVNGTCGDEWHSALPRVRQGLLARSTTFNDGRRASELCSKTGNARWGAGIMSLMRSKRGTLRQKAQLDAINSLMSLKSTLNVDH
jgi:hypothetical protein